MQTGMRTLLSLAVLGHALAGNLFAQRIDAETQRATLANLRNFAVYARVQLSQSATFPAIEESGLRNRIETALRREGIAIDTRSDVRDGSQASLDLLYVVMQTRNGKASGFA